jgi:hypothetical protein
MTDRTGRTSMVYPFIEEDRRKIRSSARESRRERDPSCYRD